MLRKLFGAVTLVLMLSMTLTAEEGKAEMVDNPMFKAWAGFKVGSTATVVEKTTSVDSKEATPDGVDEKIIMYKLVSVSDKKVVVSATVIEHEFLGTIELAPTKHHYPAKISKANLQAVAQEYDAKPTSEEIKVLGKEMKTELLSGTHKKGDVEVEYKLWYSKSVPGAIVKKSRTTKKDGKVVASTTVEVTAYKVAEK